MSPMITLKNASVTRGSRSMADSLTWTLERGRHIAVTGANGAGKTTLLKLIRGDITPDLGGERIYDFGDGPQHTVLGLRHRIAMVSADMQDFYFLHAQRTMGRSVILSGFFDTPLLYETATPEMERAADAIIGELDIDNLANSEMGRLSTGQVRKILIARALVTRPDVLLLDECLEGLDKGARTEILALLDHAAQKTTLVCAAHRAGDIPDCIDRALVMASGAITAEGDRTSALAYLTTAAPDLAACDIPTTVPDHDHEFLLRMQNVSVVADGNRILHDIDWEIRPGENWGVLGRNGAGKSTLLKLILSEIAPYADEENGTGTIHRFDTMTMDEARPLLGVVSPALQTSYARELGWEVTVMETVLSGCRGSVGMLEEPTSTELLEANSWLRRLSLESLADRPLRRLSYGQQRKVFLARAMVSSPRLLLLDEPLAGLDSSTAATMRTLLQKLAESGTPMALVTHHDEDLIPAITHILVLEDGRIVFKGTRQEYDAWKEQPCSLQ